MLPASLLPTLASWLGAAAFTACPLAVLFCAALLFTRGFCGVFRPRRYTVLKLALLCGAISWGAAAALKWGLAVGDDAARLKAGSRLVPYSGALEFSILVAPFALAVLLGCYALVTVGFKLFRFNDCEEASAVLTRVRAQPPSPSPPPPPPARAPPLCCVI